MLVLSRKKDESVIINGDIEVTIIEIRGDKVRMGITAPTEVSVNRKEVQLIVDERKKKDDQAAAAEDDAKNGAEDERG